MCAFIIHINGWLGDSDLPLINIQPRLGTLWYTYSDIYQLLHVNNTVSHSAHVCWYTGTEKIGLPLSDMLLVGRAFPDSQSHLNCWVHRDVFQSALLVFFVGLTDKPESVFISMKGVHLFAHPGYTDFWRGEGFVVRLCKQVLEVQFLYFRVGCFLQNSPGTVLSQCSSYTTKRSSYCIVTVQFLYYKKSSYCIVTVQFLY